VTPRLGHPTTDHGRFTILLFQLQLPRHKKAELKVEMPPIRVRNKVLMKLGNDFFGLNYAPDRHRMSLSLDLNLKTELKLGEEEKRHKFSLF
jgi:hypothetical protein